MSSVREVSPQFLVPTWKFWCLGFWFIFWPPLLCQRLSIARAILKESPIILLDEATSSLDAETEHKIQEAINYLTKGRTTIVIAHRLSTILNSDKIYVIDQGCVDAEGTHDELLGKSNIYKDFYEKQIKKS